MSNRVLTELLHGNGAHADPIACVEDLPFELAAQSVEGFPHSIGQLVFHMNYWMDYELRRIHDERPPFPKHNSESFPLGPSPTDAQDWDLLRRNFAGLLADLKQRRRGAVQDGGASPRSAPCARPRRHVGLDLLARRRHGRMNE